MGEGSLYQSQAGAQADLSFDRLHFALGPSFEVVISDARQSSDTLRMLRALQKPFLPNQVVLFRPDDTSPPTISKLAPYTTVQIPLHHKATAYMCQNSVCPRPAAASMMIEGLPQDVAGRSSQGAAFRLGDSRADAGGQPSGAGAADRS